MPKYYDPGYTQISVPLGSEEISPVRDTVNNVDKSITLNVLKGWIAPVIPTSAKLLGSTSGGVLQAVSNVDLTGGSLAVPTLAPGTNTTGAANSAFVQAAIAAIPSSGTSSGSGIPVAPLQSIGVNLSGGEFGASAVPGTLNGDYTYPTHAQIDYWTGKGCNIFRIPFLIERLQASLNGALRSTDLTILKDLVAYSATKNAKVILDAHNYGSMFGNTIGSVGSPNSAFANFWSRTATAFLTDSNAIFGLMNEPALNETTWTPAVNAAIAAIRATGSAHLIMVPSAFGGGQSFVYGGDGGSTATTWPGAVVDSGNNLVYEVHRYFDPSSTGSTILLADALDYIADLSNVIGWARDNGVKIFLGESGYGIDTNNLAALRTFMGYLQNNSSVVLGTTLWGAGQWWPDNYVYHLEPIGGIDQPQVPQLQRFLPGGDLRGIARAVPKKQSDPNNPASTAGIAFLPSPDTIFGTRMTGTVAKIREVLDHRDRVSLAWLYTLTEVNGLSQSMLGGTRLNIGVNGTGLLYYQYLKADGTFNTTTTAISVSIGVEHQYGVSLSPSGFNLWMDGVKVATSGLGCGALVGFFGVNCSETPAFNKATGYIRELRIYDYAAFTSVGPDFSQEITGFETGLCGYYPFNSGVSAVCMGPPPALPAMPSDPTSSVHVSSGQLGTDALIVAGDILGGGGPRVIRVEDLLRQILSYSGKTLDVSMNITNATYSAAGKFGLALQVSIGLTYGDFPPDILPVSLPWTIEFWASVQNPGGGAIMLKQDAFNVHLIGHVPYLEVNVGGAWFTLASSYTYTDTAQHHHAVVASGSTTVLYIDGISVASIAHVPDFHTTPVNYSRLIFGADLGGDNGIIGALSDIAIWSSAKYTGTFTPPTAPLVGHETNLAHYWPLRGGAMGIVP